MRRALRGQWGLRDQRVQRVQRDLQGRQGLPERRVQRAIKARRAPPDPPELLGRRDP